MSLPLNFVFICFTLFVQFTHKVTDFIIRIKIVIQPVYPMTRNFAHKYYSPSTCLSHGTLAKMRASRQPPSMMELCEIFRNKAIRFSAFDWLIYEIHSIPVFSPTRGRFFMFSHKNAAELLPPLCTFADILPLCTKSARKVFASLISPYVSRTWSYLFYYFLFLRNCIHIKCKKNKVKRNYNHFTNILLLDSECHSHWILFFLCFTLFVQFTHKVTDFIIRIKIVFSPYTPWLAISSNK